MSRDNDIFVDGAFELPPIFVRFQTLRELGKEALDRLQISSADVSYPSNVPFAAGTFSEVCVRSRKSTSDRSS